MPVARRPLTGPEWRTLAIILGASTLWLTDALHHLDPALPALLAFVALLIPGIGPLAWADLERGVGWANFFVIAASISLAHVLGASGAAAWLGRLLVGVLPGLGQRPIAIVVLLMVGATALRALVPNISGFLALALPIAMSVGSAGGGQPAGVRPRGDDDRRRRRLLSRPERLGPGHLRAWPRVGGRDPEIRPLDDARWMGGDPGSGATMVGTGR